MCTPTMHACLHALPKVEHHIHIEGSLSPDLLFTLAKANGIPLPPTDPAFTSPTTLSARYQNFTSLDDFLHYYFIGISVLITASDFSNLAYEYLLHAHSDGVHHAEIFFDPQAHTSRGVRYETVVQGLTTAQARAKSELGITSELILCFLRHLPASDAGTHFETADRLAHFSNGTVVGIGLDSSEVGFPPELFADVYARAAATKVRRTAHAGEEGDASYVSRALDHCAVERIDHGIRLVEDEALLRRIADSQVLITLCPLSNVKLRCVEAVKDLPVRTFLEKGVRFSINSDDPAYFGGYLLDNYVAVQQAFGLSLQEWRTVAVGSVQGSWCSEARRGELLGMIEVWFREWEARV